MSFSQSRQAEEIDRDSKTIHAAISKRGTVEGKSYIELWSAVDVPCVVAKIRAVEGRKTVDLCFVRSHAQRTAAVLPRT